VPLQCGILHYLLYCARSLVCMTLTRLPSGAFVRVLEMESKTATILCIDDEQTALQLRQNLLESAGYRVLGAKSGALGIKAFKSGPIDAVILDYWMADMNGLQVARELRKINSAVPIIILSAYGELLDESLGIADLWIRKGEEDPQYLLNRLEQLLKSKPAH
jgi:CheY-like chemotaxis protein